MRTYTILSEVHICREDVRSSAMLREISKGIGGGLCPYHSFTKEIFL